MTTINIFIGIQIHKEKGIVVIL